MIVPAILAILFSAALVWVLGQRDPKRLRNVASAAVSHPVRLPRSLRRLLGWMTLAPGLVLILFGQWWAFLVWLGALCVLGWITSQRLAARSPHSAH
jgi:hypothetical protein